MEYEKLTYLGVKELYPHPDNPRLDIGDITELVESVRANGILQNLTVIPGRKGTPEEMEHIKALREKLAADDKAPEKLKREALEELDEQIRDEWVANDFTERSRRSRVKRGAYGRERRRRGSMSEACGGTGLNISFSGTAPAPGGTDVIRNMIR